MYAGLTSQQVEERIRNGQINTKEERMADSTLEIIRNHTLTYFNLVNTVLLAIVIISGKVHNALFYLTVITNTVMGIWQEIKARNLLKKMSIMHEALFSVKRDGKWTEIHSDEIVMDDLLNLRAGVQIPADCIILNGVLEINESMLTGESEIVRKSSGRPVYSGTVINAGSAEVKVVRVGSQRVSSIIMDEGRKFTQSESKLAEEMEKLLKIISIVIIPAGIIIFLTQWLRTGMSWQDSAIKTVAAVVGMIPEGLVVLTSAALVVSTIRLARKQVLVQELFSIERLARVDTLCLDKTGTLTKGSMKVTGEIILDGFEKSFIEDAIRSLIASMDTANATSEALRREYGSKSVFITTRYLTFSSERKFSGAETEEQGSFYLGAPNILLKGEHPDLLEQCASYAKNGTRVLIFAHSDDPLDEDLSASRIVPAAIFTLEDELRENTAEIMEYFAKQDVTLKVISGDDPSAVSAIAARAGIPNSDKYISLHGHEPDYDAIVDQYTVFGRVLPIQKKELVEALKRKGRHVAMTGDGVNDVPSLKSADVSVAMASGAPAARDSANFVLLDDDFARMPMIVDEGRRVINNISRAASMYLVKTGFSVLLSIYVIILAHTYPFVPIQLTLLSACGVGIPTVILQLEPSFERAEGSFLLKALKKAIPSACTVMLSVFVCLALQKYMNLSPQRYSGLLMVLTGFIYMYTLVRVYQPMTKLRAAVISAMSCLLIGAVFLAGNVFDAKLLWSDLLIALCAVAVIPVVITGFSRILELAWGFVTKQLPEKK